MLNLGKLPLYYVSSDDHPGPVLVDHNGLKIISCLKCGYYHQYPLPSPAQIARYYATNDTFYRDSDGWFHKERLEHEAGLWNPMYHWQANLLKQTSPDTNWLVDLGTGAGWYVKFWADNYGHSIGVEPSRTARGQSPCPNRIEPNLKLAAKRFRVNTSSTFLRAALVLEHLPDPVGFLKEGLGAFPNCTSFMVIVPSDFSDIQLKINKSLPVPRCYWWVTKDHLNYFTPSGLRWTMEAAGLTVQFMGVTAPVELAALAGYAYIGDDKKGQKLHRLRLRLERLPGTFALYQWAFRRWGIGRELVAIGVPSNRSDQ